MGKYTLKPLIESAMPKDLCSDSINQRKSCACAWGQRSINLAERGRLWGHANDYSSPSLLLPKILSTLCAQKNTLSFLQEIESLLQGFSRRRKLQVQVLWLMPSILLMWSRSSSFCSRHQYIKKTSYLPCHRLNFQCRNEDRTIAINILIESGRQNCHWFTTNSAISLCRHCEGTLPSTGYVICRN